MFGRKRIPESEWAMKLEASLRELGPQRARAEALLARMTPADRRRTEKVIIQSGPEHWERIERIMLRFGELAPPADDVPPLVVAEPPTPVPPGSDASTAPADEVHAPGARPLTGESYEAQRARVNRALGR